MVGSSASAGGVGLSGGLAGGGGGGIAGSTGFDAAGGGDGGAGAGLGVATGGGAGAGAGAGTAGAGTGGVAGAVAIGVDEPDGRGPEPLGMKEKSSASDDEIHGTCSWREARGTPTRVRFSVSSAIKSGVRISFSSSFTNRLRSLPLSETTDDSAAEYITSVPFGAITGARPAEKLRNRRSNGLRLLASIKAILTPAPRLLISPSTVSRLKPSRRTSASVQICASPGIMKLWRLDCTPKPLKKISATEPGLIRPYSRSKARRIASP